jgi:hypothetical protein
VWRTHARTLSSVSDSLIVSSIELAMLARRLSDGRFSGMRSTLLASTGKPIKLVTTPRPRNCFEAVPETRSDKDKNGDPPPLLVLPWWW